MQQAKTGVVLQGHMQTNRDHKKTILGGYSTSNYYKDVKDMHKGRRNTQGSSLFISPRLMASTNNSSVL